MVSSSSVGVLTHCLCIAFLLLRSGCINAFSQQHEGKQDGLLLDLNISRRDYWKVSLGVVGGVAYGKLVGDTLVKLSQGIERPKAHEERVRAMISTAFVESAQSRKASNEEPFRILEVGIGTDCRLIRRGLYRDGLAALASMHISKVELKGTDLTPPSPAIVDKARVVLSEETRDQSMMNVGFETTPGDMSSGLPFASGYFDSIICCLTLCSVANQEDAIREIKRLVRPTGGTFGYVEHVAVDPDEPYRLLEWQQEVLDPLQNKLADNCHLHRYTSNVIDGIFLQRDESGAGERLEQARFLVDDMWPVTCQASGVIRMEAKAA